MHARHSILDAGDMQAAVRQVDLVPSQGAQLRSSQPVPKGQQDHSRIPVPIAVVGSSLDARCDGLPDAHSLSFCLAVGPIFQHDPGRMDHARDNPVMTEPSGQQRRPAAALLTDTLLLALGLGWLGGSNAYRFFELLYKPNKLRGDDRSCLTHRRSSTELTEARSYLIQTASPGYTMAKQGSELAIERLHPEFAIRLTKALREARDYGLLAGIYSAYRPPAFGVGGFSDKFNSLHAYGLAVDLYGIGRPGSVETLWWHEIAAKHGVICPYGHHDRAEWNHCQPTGVKVVSADNRLRETITADGPVSLEAMFEAGNSAVERPANAADTVGRTQQCDEHAHRQPTAS